MDLLSFFSGISNRAVDHIFQQHLNSEVEVISSIVSPSVFSRKNFGSITLAVLPMVNPTLALPCFLVSIFVRNNNDSSSSLMSSSFIFWDTQVNHEGKIVTVYNFRNILLAGVATSAAATALGYFIYGNGGRTKIVASLPSLSDFADLKTNCMQVAHIHKTLVKFVGESEKNAFPPMNIQQHLVGWIHSDLLIMKNFLDSNEDWIVLWSLQDKSTLECLNKVGLIGPLYVRACSTSPVLKTFCDSLNK